MPGLPGHAIDPVDGDDAAAGGNSSAMRHPPRTIARLPPRGCASPRSASSVRPGTRFSSRTDRLPCSTSSLRARVSVPCRRARRDLRHVEDQTLPRRAGHRWRLRTRPARPPSSAPRRTVGAPRSKQRVPRRSDVGRYRSSPCPVPDPLPPTSPVRRTWRATSRCGGATIVQPAAGVTAEETRLRLLTPEGVPRTT